jgi:excisionase family DNA binding protein
MEQQKEKRLSIREAAQFFGCSRATVDRMCKADGLPFHQVRPGRKGSRRYFFESEILKWKTSREKN